MQSEVYLTIALKDWLAKSSPGKPGERSGLVYLAKALRQNQQDLWLTDFLDRPFVPEATKLLMSAIDANYQGDQNRAVKDGMDAAARFKRLGNLPGTTLSEYQVIYALRRLSKSKECLQHIFGLDRTLHDRSYKWLELQVTMEKSVCAGLNGHFDQAAQLADRVVAMSLRANYPSLELRSLSLLASWHTAEGRVRQSWRSNEEGLSDFWNASFPAERGFQLYSDLELTAERTQLWRLALALQREVLAMINETERLDFQATAHLHLAIAAAATGDAAGAQQEFDRAASLFTKLPQTPAVQFLEADNEIGLVQLEIDQGKTEDARQKLIAIDHAIAGTTSFAVRLRNKRTWAALARRLADTGQEKLALQEAVSIGIQGYRGLKSDRDRWEWNHEVEEPYRRLLELEIERPHAPEQALADWELYKFRQSTGAVGFSDDAIANSGARQSLMQIYAEDLKGSTLVSFAVFPRWTVVWMVDEQGVHEERIPIASEDLRHAVQDFLILCSDPNSSLEKVKSEGLRLYKVLLEPVSSRMNLQAHLYIESDRFLGQLPWAALVTGSGSYLGESYSLVHIAGLFYGKRSVELPGAHTGLLLAAPGGVTLEGEHYPPLSHEGEEIGYILGLNPKATYLHDAEVNSKTLRRSLPTASIFHFVGHAITRDSGGELLIHGETGDKLFSTFSLADLALPSRLIVLSACSTALSESDAARDPHGLVRAFLEHGARQVIASNWQIDSASTAMLMRDFYAAFFARQDAARALQQATSKMVGQTALSHPYYWSAFELFSTTIPSRENDN